MNKKQYNNVIENTLKHEQTDDSLSTARAIFDNMGIALPQGDMKVVYEFVDKKVNKKCIDNKKLVLEKDYDFN